MRTARIKEERFKSLLVEGQGQALLSVAAYVDLNAVRAGIVKDPKDYRFCGYGESVAGKHTAHEGLGMVMRTAGQPTSGCFFERQCACDRRHEREICGRNEALMTPNDRKFTKSHEWIKIEGNLAVIGVTDYAQKAMGDVTYVEMPNISQSVKQGKACAVIESVKAASDLCAPVSGVVVEINESLANTPEIVNQDPYQLGWILKLRTIDAAELASLLDAAAYEAFVEAKA